MVVNTIVPAVVENGNKGTVASKLGKAKPVAIHDNNHGNTEFTNTGLKFNNILGAHIVKEKEGCFYGWANMYDKWNSYYYIPTGENEPRSLHTFTGDDSIFNLNKTKHKGKSTTRLVSEVQTSENRIFTLANVKNKYGIFEANY